MTLAEYVSRMKEDQKVIYYAAGDDRGQDRQAAPDWRALKESGARRSSTSQRRWTSSCAQILRTYQDKEFRSAMDGASDEAAQEKAKEEADAHKDVFAFVKETLGDAVAGGETLHTAEIAPCMSHRRRGPEL